MISLLCCCYCLVNNMESNLPLKLCSDNF